MAIAQSCNDAACVQDVIEARGYGRAQIMLVALTACVAYIMEGFMVRTLSAAARAHFGVDANLTWVIALDALLGWGIELGAVVGLLFGDVMGRRWVIVRALAVSALASWICALAPSYVAMVSANLVAKVSVGALFVPCLAFASECTPRDARVFHRVVAVDTYNSLLVFLAISAVVSPSGLSLTTPTVDAPSLCCIPFASAASIAGLFVYLYLPESPVFLAASGQSDEAWRELEQMRRVDGGEPDDGERPHAPAVGGGRVLSLFERLGEVCSGQSARIFLLLSCTIWISKTTAVFMNEEYLTKTEIFFSAAVLGRWFDVTCNVMRIIGEVLAYFNARTFSRSVALANAVLWFATWITVFALLSPMRQVGGPIVEAIVEVAGAMLVYGNRVVLTVAYLVAVEAFPTMVSVTAGSIIIRMGGSDGKYMGMMSIWGWVPFGTLPFCLSAQMAVLAALWYVTRDPSSAAMISKMPPYGTFSSKLGA